MSEWLPVLAGFGGLAIIFLFLSFFPDSTWATEGKRSIGVRPSGAYLVKTPKDHLRTAAISAITAPILFGLAVWGYALGDRFSGSSRTSWTAQTYGFGFALLAAMAGVVSIGSLVGALFWRPRIIDGDPGVPAQSLAEALTLFAEGEASDDAWPDFDAIRYADPAVESIRARMVREFPHGRPPNQPEDAGRLSAYIGELVELIGVEADI
jgi:hypothetical protein